MTGRLPGFRLGDCAPVSIPDPKDHTLDGVAFGVAQTLFFKA
jgi:hypothetical protein